MLFVQLSLANETGQIMEPIALEIKRFVIYGGDCNGGVWIDVWHLDGEHERMRLSIEQVPFGAMSMGDQDTHMVSVVHYPAADILTKAQWRERVGIGTIFAK